jgi:preprotein translocase subunit SecD
VEVVAGKPSRRTFTYGIAAAAATLAAVFVGLEWPRNAVMAAVRFEVRLAEDSPGLELDRVTLPDSGERIYLHRPAVLTNADIASAESVRDASGSFGVVVRFTRDGAGKLLQATRRNIGRRLAILLDGQVVIAPSVRSPISTSAVISGGYTKAEADGIAAGIVGR